jgi:hypothetical protein
VFYFKNSTYIKIRAQRAKSKNKVKALLLLLLLLASQSSRRAHLRKIGDFASCGQGDPDTPTAPKGAAVNRKVSQWQFTTVQSNQFRGQMVARLWHVQRTEQAKNWSVTHTEKRRTTPEKLASNTPKFLPQLGQILTF